MRHAPTPHPFAMRITGQVLSTECRFEAGGKPVVVVELGTEMATVRATHRYPDNTATSAIAARALCARIKGQRIEFDATAASFKTRLMSCEAAHINTLTTRTTRKDFE